MSSIHLSLLGSPEFKRDDTPVELKSAKGVALLAYLAVTGTMSTREHLVDLLWSDSLPDAARKNLRNTLWAIRKSLRDDLVVVDGDRIGLSPGVSVDVSVFEAENMALQSDTSAATDTAIIKLYRGPFLDGLAPADAPEFELWLTAERERLGQLFLRGLERLAAKQSSRQDWQGVIDTARHALATDGLQEPMHRVLMQAHAVLGERVEALRQYDILRAKLSSELGVEPLPETEQLRQDILDGTMELPRSLPPKLSAQANQPARPPQSLPATPFVGRVDEMSALDRVLETVAGGSARVVLITGELGIGKSRLWQEWSAGLIAAHTVLKARCLDTNQSLPFAPLTGLFRQSPCARHLLEQDTPVSPVWLAELARLLSEIKQHRPDLPVPPDLPPQEEHRRLFEAFTQVLLTIDDHPLVLFIDDLHWVDQATLDWLVYLTDRLQQHPLLLIGAYRPDEASPRLSRVTAGWGRSGILHRLPLQRLTLTESTELVTALGRREEDAESLYTRSAGNPYFLTELSQAEVEGTPPGLEELIRARLSQLPDDARQVLQVAAVLQDEFDLDILRRTSGRGEEETLNALDSLLEAAVLIERDGGHEFAHPVVASVVNDDLSLARRSFLHRQAAEALESVYANQLDVMAGRLFAHYVQAGRPTLAARYAEQAGKRSLELTAYAEAAIAYRQAVQLEDTSSRRLGLGQALIGLDEMEQGREELKAAGALSEHEQELTEAARAYLELAQSYLPAGSGEDVLHWAKKAVTTLESLPDPATHASLHHLLAAGGLLAGEPLAQAEAHLLEAIEVAEANDLPELAGVGRFELGNVLAQRGQLRQAIASFEAALAQAGDSLNHQMLSHNNLAYHLMLAENLTEALSHIEAALALADKHVLLGGRQYLYSTRGEISLALGDMDGAEVWLEKALTEARRNNNQPHAAGIKANFGLVARERGDLDEALLLLEEAHSAVANLRTAYLRIKIDLWLAELYLERGERAAASLALERAQTGLSDSEMLGLQAWAHRVQDRLGG